MTKGTRRRLRRRAWHGDLLAVLGALLAGAAFLTVQQLASDLRAANQARDALATQVQRLGATPVAGPPGSRGKEGRSVTGARGRRATQAILGRPASPARPGHPDRPDRPGRTARPGRVGPMVSARPALPVPPDRPVPRARRGSQVLQARTARTAPQGLTDRPAPRATACRPRPTTPMPWCADETPRPATTAQQDESAVSGPGPDPTAVRVNVTAPASLREAGAVSSCPGSGGLEDLALHRGRPRHDQPLVLGALLRVQGSAGAQPERADLLVEVVGRPCGTRGRVIGGHVRSVRGRADSRPRSFNVRRRGLGGRG
jgi:hypothetical protein